MFPIDLVYTWVDGSDPKHAAKRKLYAKKTKRLITDSNCPARFRANEELQESIKSALTFIPWVHKIYIVVADGQYPQHLPKDARISVVPHSQIYGSMNNHLPTFNSHSIESHLFRIPGISECFIYANDDTFFGTPLSPNFFFTKNGLPKVLLSHKRLPEGPPNRNTPPYQAAKMNDMALLNKVYKKKHRYSPLHQVKAISKTLYKSIWSTKKFNKFLVNTSASRFRATSDLEPVGFALQVGLESGLAVRGTGTSYYGSIGDKSNITSLLKNISKGFNLYCINDVTKNPSSRHMAVYRNALRTMLPHHKYSMRIMDAQTPGKTYVIDPPLSKLSHVVRSQSRVKSRVNRRKLQTSLSLRRKSTTPVRRITSVRKTSTVRKNPTSVHSRPVHTQKPKITHSTYSILKRTPLVRPPIKKRKKGTRRVRVVKHKINILRIQKFQKLKKKNRRKK